MRKFFLFLFLILIPFSVVRSETTVETGILTNNTTAVDTIFFTSQKTGNLFKANYVFIKLDESASGDMIIRRGVKKYRHYSNNEIEWLDAVTNTIKPSGTFKTEYKNIFCFYYSKSLATDKISYLASSISGTEIEGSNSSTATDSLVVLWNDNSDNDGLLISQDLATTLKTLNVDLAPGDTLLIDGGIINDYSRIYFKALATTFPDDSLGVRFATSEDASWDAGNASFFGDTLALGGYGIYGHTHAITDGNGNFIPGDHLLIRIINWNIEADSLIGLSTQIIKTR